jgi:hypothetical protein
MKIGNSFHRDTLITILLILAGIVLALILFGAGAVWRGRGPSVYLHRAAFPVLNQIQPLEKENYENS